jgi:hypothetical protein
VVVVVVAVAVRMNDYRYYRRVLGVAMLNPNGGRRTGAKASAAKRVRECDRQ